MGKHYNTYLQEKLDRPLTSAPAISASYICNRCKGRGHYVEECPTNEDPAYDLAASRDYFCKYCKERGTHYSLFCSRNPDPNSIYQRRLANGLYQSHPLPTRQELGERFESYELHLFNSHTLSRASRMNQGNSSSLELPKTNFEKFTGVKGVTSREGFRGDIKEKMDNVEIDMKGVAMSDILGLTENGLESSEFNSSDSHLNSEPPQISEADSFLDNLVNEFEEGNPKYLRPGASLAKRLTAFKETPTPCIKLSPHAEFLTKLFANHPSQPNLKWRKRITALDLWDISDEKKLREEDTAMLGSSETIIEIDSFNLRRKRNKKHKLQGWTDEEMEVDDEQLGQQTKQVKFATHTVSYRNQNDENGKNEDQKDLEGYPRAEKLYALQKKIHSIEDLRTKLFLWGEVEISEIERMTSGDLSQRDSTRSPAELDPKNHHLANSSLLLPYAHRKM